MKKKYYEYKTIKKTNKLNKLKPDLKYKKKKF